ncbi:hypothetical protein GCK32_022237, partial [Trichostrongylus colubriformis]
SFHFIPHFPVFPLARNAVNYCLRKKNEPQIGLDLALSAMRVLVDPNEGIVSSLHSALFAVCVRLNNVDAAMPYIYRNVTALVNEVSALMLFQRRVFCFLFSEQGLKVFILRN